MREELGEGLNVTKIQHMKVSKNKNITLNLY